MDRLFGKAKPKEPVVEEEKPPVPTLGETSDKVSLKKAKSHFGT